MWVYFHNNGPLAWNSSCFVIEQLSNSNLNLDITAELLTLQISPEHLDRDAFTAKELLEKEIYVYEN